MGKHTRNLKLKNIQHSNLVLEQFIEPTKKDKEVTPIKESEIKIEYFNKGQLKNEPLMERNVLSLSEQMVKSRDHYKKLLK